MEIAGLAYPHGYPSCVFVDLDLPFEYIDFGESLVGQDNSFITTSRKKEGSCDKVCFGPDIGPFELRAPIEYLGGWKLLF